MTPPVAQPIAPNQDISNVQTTQLIAALEHVHAQNYISRDIRPENILVSDKGDTLPILGML